MSAAIKELNRLREENRRLKAIIDLGTILVDPVLPLNAKLQHCVKVLSSLAKAESVSLMLVENDQLEVRAATNPRIIGLTSKLDQKSISADVIKKARPLLISDISRSPYAAACRQGDRSNYRTKSLVSVPLLESGRAVGVLNLSDKENGQAFGSEDLDLVLNIAEQLSARVNFSAVHSRLARAYQELEGTQNAKDELMHMIFHDMKAPITGVKEILKLLATGPALTPAEQAHYLALADGDLELLWRRISNLLDLNRMDSKAMPLSLIPAGLADLVKEAISHMTGLSRGRGVEIELEDMHNPELIVDEDLVERIAVNLLSNAIKASSPEEGGGGKVWVAILPKEGGFELTVRDSGRGVHESFGQDVFKRFTDKARNAGSTGLGLYFCRRAAELLEGSVNYRNLPEGGAEFFLTLPGYGSAKPVIQV